MARLLKEIVIQGKPAKALFDTGSMRSYVLKEFTEGAPSIKAEPPYTVGLGGRTITVTEECILRGEIEGLGFTMKAVPLGEIGAVDGHEIGVIVGATVMEEWELRIDLAKGELDLSGLRRREFTEF